MKIDGIHYMMPTVFKDSDSIDIESMINIANYAKKSGCVGLVLLGVMGEAHRLDESEKILLLEEISNVSREVKLLLTVGVSAESGYLASSFAAKASELGANQVMLAPPIMKKPNEQILYRYYKDVNDSISKNTSLVVQDLPDQSGVYMSPEFMTHLDNNLEKINSIKLEDPPTPKKITKIMNLKSTIKYSLLSIGLLTCLGSYAQEVVVTDSSSIPMNEQVVKDTVVEKGKQRRKVDGIAAVVGQFIILDSDIDLMYKDMQSQGISTAQVTDCNLAGSLMENKLYAHHLIMVLEIN